MTDNPKNQTNDVLTPWPETQPSFSPNIAQPPAPVNTGGQQVLRDEKGQFVSGTSPNPKGRPKGARNKFTETFMRTLAEDFKANGLDALAQLRQTNPEAYLRIIIAILPKSLIKHWEDTPEVDYSSITEEQFIELVQEIERQKRMEQVIETVSK